MSVSIHCERCAPLRGQAGERGRRTLPGPFRSLLICSLYRASSPSSFLILTSIEAIRLSVCVPVAAHQSTAARCSRMWLRMDGVLPTEEMASWRVGRGFLLDDDPNMRFMVKRTSWDARGMCRGR